jgi:hypothetical protein
MAGEDPTGAFNGDEFRASIRSAMLMGLPNSVEDQPTFRFEQPLVYDDVDAEGSPFDWETIPVVEDAREPVRVLCAVETIGQGEASEGTNIGTFDMNRARLYIFDDEWALVDDFTSVVLSGSEYERIKELPILGLFDVDVHVVEIRARDEA